MKTTDLMIGDWLTANRRECVGDGGQFIAWKEIGKIARIYEDTVTLLFPTREDDWEEMYLMDVEPIPLTPEILEKNGWEKCNIDVVDDDEQYGCAYDSFYFTWWRKVKLLGCYFEDKNVGLHYEMISELSTKYIHELQHALKLCGIEKDIEL